MSWRTFGRVATVCDSGRSLSGTSLMRRHGCASCSASPQRSAQFVEVVVELRGFEPLASTMRM